MSCCRFLSRMSRKCAASLRRAATEAGLGMRRTGAFGAAAGAAASFRTPNFGTLTTTFGTILPATFAGTTLAAGLTAPLPAGRGAAFATAGLADDLGGTDFLGAAFRAAVFSGALAFFAMTFTGFAGAVLTFEGFAFMRKPRVTP